MHPFDYYQQLKLLEDEREREIESYNKNLTLAQTHQMHAQNYQNIANYYASLGFNCSVDNHRTKGLAHLINGKWQKRINFDEVNRCPKCNGHNRNMYNQNINNMNNENSKKNNYQSIANTHNTNISILKTNITNWFNQYKLSYKK